MPEFHFYKIIVQALIHTGIRLAHEIGQTSSAIPLSLQISIIFGCFTIENLIVVSLITSGFKRYLPMPYAFRPKEYSIVQIIVSHCPVSECLSCVEKEGNLYTLLLLSEAELLQWFQIINQRL